MNAHAPQQATSNEPSMREKYLLFDLETYGSKVNYAQKTVSIPYELQRHRRLVTVALQVRAQGWHVQIGII